MPSMHIVNLHTWKQTLIKRKLVPAHRLSELGPLIFTTNSCIPHSRLTFRTGPIALIYRKHLWLLSVVLALFSQPYVAHMAMFWAQQWTSSSLELSSLFILSSRSLSLSSPQQFIPKSFALVPACSHWLSAPCWMDGFRTFFLERRGRGKRGPHWLFSVCETLMTIILAGL